MSCHQPSAISHQPFPRISVFTPSTPWLPLAELIPAVAAAGYDGIEIGLRDRRFDPAKPANFWGNNPAMIDWTDAVGEARGVRAALDRAGLACPCVGSYASTDDRQRFATVAEVAVVLGAGLARVRLPAHDPAIGYAAQFADARSAFRDLAELGAARGLCFLVELHDHSLCPSPSSAMRLLDGLGTEHVGVIFEPANMAIEGNESLPMAIDLLGPSLKHVHVKDVRPVTHAAVKNLSRLGAGFAPLGEGMLDWPGIVRELAARDYRGWLSVENFTGIERGIERLAADAQWVKGLLA